MTLPPPFRVEQIDSELLGRTALSLTLSDGLAAGLAQVEADYVKQHSPAVATIKVPVESMELAHRFEEAGFRVVETQLRCVAPTRARKGPSLGLRLSPVKTAAELQPLLPLLESSFQHDRFRNDPAYPAGFSQERYRRFLAASLVNEGERVYALTRSDGRIVGLKSHRLEANATATLLLGGLEPDAVGFGFGAISGQLELALLASQGIKEVITHYPARNYGIINLELRGLGFHVVAAFYVLRKIYR